MGYSAEHTWMWPMAVVSQVPRLHTEKEVVISLLSLKERLPERVMVCVGRHDRFPCVSQFIAFKSPLDLKLVRESRN